MSWWIWIIIILAHVMCGLICAIYFIGGSIRSYSLNLFELVGLIILGPILVFFYICSVFIIKIDDSIRKLKKKINERKSKI